MIQNYGAFIEQKLAVPSGRVELDQDQKPPGTSDL